MKLSCSKWSRMMKTYTSKFARWKSLMPMIMYKLMHICKGHFWMVLRWKWSSQIQNGSFSSQNHSEVAFIYVHQFRADSSVWAAICQRKVRNSLEIHNQSRIIEDMKWAQRFNLFEREIDICTQKERKFVSRAVYRSERWKMALLEHMRQHSEIILSNELTSGCLWRDCIHVTSQSFEFRFDAQYLSKMFMFSESRFSHVTMNFEFFGFKKKK
jgi:hypothetical protein